MLKPICLSFLVLCVFTLCGCGGNSEVEQLSYSVHQNGPAPDQLD